ncbi:MAG: tetratricopeptide repeat protein, partial [Deltaproteobacteria bacterium]|nr:tetratricopeptide repeat protein [Deltaproteobacteria bacterium]
EAGAGRPNPVDPSNPRSRRMASLPQAVQQKAAPQQGSPPAAAAADEGAMRLAELFLGLGDFESAEKVLRKEDRKRPGSAGLQLGWALYFQGKYPEALELADGQIRGSAYSHIGIHVETDSDGAGIRVLRLVEGAPAESAGVRAGDTITAADGEPMQGKNVPILVNKIKSGAVGVPIALTLARSGEKAPIELSVKRGVSYPNSAAGAFGLRSLVHRAMGKPGPAAEDARRLSELAPGWFLSHYTAGLSSLDGGSAEAAASAFEKAIAAAAVRTTNGVLPETFVIHARLALAGARARQGRMDEVEALCRALPEADLTERDVPLSKSRALFLAPMKPVREGLLAAASKSEREGKPAEALPALSRALPLAESPAEAKAIRGRIVKVSSGLRSLPEVPDKARRHGVRGELLVKEGKMADALPEFRLASREAPYIPLFHMNRALVCGEVGRYEEAIRSMEEYLALSPAAPNARQGKDAVIQWELKLEQQRKDA